MVKHYPICLTERQRRELERLVESKRELARKITRARILLLADAGRKKPEIAAALQISNGTVYNVCRRFSKAGSISCLEEKPRSGQPRKLTESASVQIVALACAEPPKGRKRCSLRKLADRAVELKLVNSVSYESVRRLLKQSEMEPPCLKEANLT